MRTVNKLSGSGIAYSIVTFQRWPTVVIHGPHKICFGAYQGVSPNKLGNTPDRTRSKTRCVGEVLTRIGITPISALFRLHVTTVGLANLADDSLSRH
jgi:hypothetical protein